MEDLQLQLKKKENFINNRNILLVVINQETHLEAK